MIKMLWSMVSKAAERSRRQRHDTFCAPITYLMFVVASDSWCGAVNGCPAMEGDDVTFGCYGQYDWLSYWIREYPVASISSTIEFTEDPSTRKTIAPVLPFGDVERPPASEVLTTNYTYQNVSRGPNLTASCLIQFTFEKRTGYSGRNTYATNSLQYRCSASRAVNCEYFRFYLATLYKRGIWCQNSVCLFISK